MPFPAFLVYSKLRKTSSIVSILGILYISSRYCFFTFFSIFLARHNEAVENIKNEDYEEALISLIAMSGDEATKWNGYSVDEF
jgi:hypothetical protein